MRSFSGGKRKRKWRENIFRFSWVPSFRKAERKKSADRGRYSGWGRWGVRGKDGGGWYIGKGDESTYGGARKCDREVRSKRFYDTDRRRDITPWRFPRIGKAPELRLSLLSFLIMSRFFSYLRVTFWMCWSFNIRLTCALQQWVLSPFSWMSGDVHSSYIKPFANYSQMLMNAYLMKLERFFRTEYKNIRVYSEGIIFLLILWICQIYFILKTEELEN